MTTPRWISNDSAEFTHASAKVLEVLGGRGAAMEIPDSPSYAVTEAMQTGLASVPNMSGPREIGG